MRTRKSVSFLLRQQHLLKNPKNSVDVNRKREGEGRIRYYCAVLHQVASIARQLYGIQHQAMCNSPSPPQDDNENYNCLPPVVTPDAADARKVAVGQKRKKKNLSSAFISHPHFSNERKQAHLLRNFFENCAQRATACSISRATLRASATTSAATPAQEAALKP